MITVQKRSHLGVVRLEYKAEVVARGESWVCVRAIFNIPDKDAGYVVFRRGDTFIEWHYADRWYNVFALYDVEGGRFKGWYCNITRPAHLGDDLIYADDLALDVYISPTREIVLDDEDEFEALQLTPDETRAVWNAVEAIRRAVAAHEPPFDK